VIGESETPEISVVRRNSVEAGGALSVEVRVHETSAESQDSNLEGGTGFAFGSETMMRWAVLGAVLLIAGLYVGPRIGQGWVPADDGTLGQSALRVLQGQLPHRDYVEIYTGGLSVLHALAFRVLGVNLMSLRVCVFLFFLMWLPAVYYIALRFTSPLGAGLSTLLAVSWSFPNYPAAMPSWYNLFLATFGAAAILRFLEVRQRRWLFVAGVCGGLSILIKVIGAYYVAGVLLFFVFLEQSENGSNSERNSGLGYRIFSTCGLLAFLGTLIYVMRGRLSPAELYHFVLPSVVLVGLILLREASAAGGTLDRLRRVWRLGVPFGSGVLIPIAVFLTPYAWSGTLGSFFHGVLSSAAARAKDLAVIRPAPAQYAVFVLPLVALLAAALFWDKFQGRVVGGAIGLGAVVIVVRATQSASVLSGIWFSAVTLTPVVVVAGACALFAMKNRHCDAQMKSQQLMLLVSLAATCSLVQYPFAAPIYLCYTLPLTLLALLAIVSSVRRERGTYVLASLAGLYLAFGVVSLVPMQLAELTHKVGRMDRLQLERGGLRMENAQVFEDVTHFLQVHAPNGVMYAGNDCPELYFLAGLKNVTRDDTGASAEDVLRALDSNDVKLVVINEAPFFPAARMNAQVRAAVERKFPHHAPAWIFQVFWRD
jgi:hypothetical protein